MDGRAIVNTGWLCPSCGRGVAPSEKTCDHGGQVQAAQPYLAPIYQPGYYPPAFYPNLPAYPYPWGLPVTCLATSGGKFEMRDAA
jgi:hypothetical protein